MRSIAIVGAGFCGAVLAANLLRQRFTEVAQIRLFERREDVGRGPAYARRELPYILNVPAERMSADSAQPEQFLQFARFRYPLAAGGDFLPRELYGDYLEWFLREAETAAQAHPQGAASISRMHADVVCIARDGAGFRLQTADGTSHRADAVVLATGNPPPAELSGIGSIREHPAYTANPWQGELNFSATDTIMTIGTGLTMADVVGAVIKKHPVAKIHALSRHGLVPPTQTSFRPNVHACNTDTLLAAAGSVRALMHATRRLSRESEFLGGDWREVVTTARLVAPQLWQSLDLAQRRRFLRHVRSYWDVHRHRLPPDVCAGLDALQLMGKLQVHAGRLLSVTASGAKLIVDFRPRGSDVTQRLEVDRLVNCTGPDYGLRRSGDPLTRQLLAAGLLTPDELDLGARTGAHGVALDANGRAITGLHVLGPLLRADHWEATAASELRLHAEALARSFVSA